MVVCKKVNRYAYLGLQYDLQCHWHWEIRVGEAKVDRPLKPNRDKIG